MQNARENPIAAVVQGKASESQNNVENLLDIDFDGAAPASTTEKPSNGLSGLEGLAGTPQRIASPTVTQPAPANNMDDLLGVFGNESSSAGPSGPSAFGGMSDSDIMNGFASMDISGSQPPPPTQQLENSGPKKTNEDLLSLF